LYTSGSLAANSDRYRTSGPGDFPFIRFFWATVSALLTNTTTHTRSYTHVHTHTSTQRDRETRGEKFARPRSETHTRYLRGADAIGRCVCDRVAPTRETRAPERRRKNASARIRSRAYHHHHHHHYHHLFLSNFNAAATFGVGSTLDERAVSSPHYLFVTPTAAIRHTHTQPSPPNQVEFTSFSTRLRATNEFSWPFAGTNKRKPSGRSVHSGP